MQAIHTVHSVNAIHAVHKLRFQWQKVKEIAEMTNQIKNMSNENVEKFYQKIKHSQIITINENDMKKIKIDQLTNQITSPNIEINSVNPNVFSKQTNIKI